MVKQYRRALIMVGILIVAGTLVYRTRGLPLIKEQHNWSIGIYTGDSPFSLSRPENIHNPVLTVLDVTDAMARFVADPFMVREDDTWYMFFEVYDYGSDQGEIALATSQHGNEWAYQRIVLDEPFHLSYPYVFKWEGEYYMVPESAETNSVRLYKADAFPYEWRYTATLLEGLGFIDNSLAYYHGYWWMFSSFEGNDSLRLYFASDLLGPWQEHPQSPIIEGNPYYARPGGRVLVYDDRLFRCTQANEPHYGFQVSAFEITAISPTTYTEELVDETPVVKASGSGWNQDAMHAVDLHQLSSGQWISPVDGFGIVRIFELPFVKRETRGQFAFQVP